MNKLKSIDTVILSVFFLLINLVNNVNVNAITEEKIEPVMVTLNQSISLFIGDNPTDLELIELAQNHLDDGYGNWLLQPEELRVERNFTTDTLGTGEFIITGTYEEKDYTVTVFVEVIEFQNHSPSTRGIGTNTLDDYQQDNNQIIRNATGTWGYFTTQTINGFYAWCIENAVIVSPGALMSGSNTYPSVSTDKLLLMQKVAYYGYPYNNFTGGYYAQATQALIKEIQNGSVFNLYVGGNLVDISKEKNDIMHLVNTDGIFPSWNNTTLNLVEGESVTLDDNNSVTNLFSLSNIPNVTVSQSGSSITITANSIGTATVSFNKNTNHDGSGLLYWTSPSSQDMIVSRRQDPDIATLNVNVRAATGNFEINKLDKFSNVYLQSAVFEIKDSTGNIVDTITTDIDGKATSIDLTYGDYTYKEIQAPYGYILDSKIYYFTIDENNINVKVTAYNTHYADITIKKIDKDTREALPGATFEFFAVGTDGEVIEYIDGITNNFSISDTAKKYLLTGILDENYVIQSVNSKGDITLENVVSNDIEQISYYLTQIELTNKYVTNHEGEIHFDFLPQGEYGIREITAPDGYIINKEMFYFTVTEEDSELTVYRENTKMELIETGTRGFTYLILSFSILMITIKYILNKSIRKKFE